MKNTNIKICSHVRKYILHVDLKIKILKKLDIMCLLLKIEFNYLKPKIRLFSNLKQPKLCFHLESKERVNHFDHFRPTLLSSSETPVYNVQIFFIFFCNSFVYVIIFYKYNMFFFLPLLLFSGPILSFYLLVRYYNILVRGDGINIRKFQL